MTDRSLYFNFESYTGLDIFRYLMPKTWQVKSLAKNWLRFLTPPHGEAPDPKKTPLIIQTPWGSFRVMDSLGNVERCKREYLGV